MARRKGQYSWLFHEPFSKRGHSSGFRTACSYSGAISLKSAYRSAGAGWWGLDKQCSNSEGIEMAEDSWHDDRMDLELSTRCFAAKIKKTRSDVKFFELDNSGRGVRYFTSKPLTITASAGTPISIGLPLPDLAEELVARWIALGIINSTGKPLD